MASQNSQQPQGLPGPPRLPNPYKAVGLPNPYASAVVSAPPVRYDNERAKAEEQKKPTALLIPHNIKRPQPKNTGYSAQKPKMPAMSAASKSGASTSAPTQRHGIDYYRSTAEDDAAVLDAIRKRNQEERQRKKEEKDFRKKYGYYNPTGTLAAHHYSNLAAFKASGGWRRKKQAFKSFLRKARAQASAQASTQASAQASAQANSQQHSVASRNDQSASTSQADPVLEKITDQQHEDKFGAQSAGFESNSAPPPSDSTGLPVPADMQNVQTDSPTTMHKEAFGTSHVNPPASYIPPPPPSSFMPPPPPPFLANQGASMSGSAVSYAGATISAPPVRFDRPDVEMQNVDESMEEERPSKRQKLSVAEAMMSKMGYVKGKGLGKNNDGILTHLEVKRRKDRSAVSTEDERNVQSQQVWDVSGGHRSQKNELDKFGKESRVIVTWGCIDGIDWKQNAQRNDGGIRQDMGDVFGAKFGPIEQVHIDEANKDGVVYISFNSTMAALNAVNRFDEGYEFRGRKIRALYYDEAKFIRGNFDF